MRRRGRSTPSRSAPGASPHLDAVARLHLPEERPVVRTASVAPGRHEVTWRSSGLRCIRSTVAVWRSAGAPSRALFSDEAEAAEHREREHPDERAEQDVLERVGAPAHRRHEDSSMNTPHRAAPKTII